MMNLYIGNKSVTATPMSRLEYNNLRGWDLPADENGEDEGYLVEYMDGGQANTSMYRGYISWSPKGVFEGAYRPNGEFRFGDALGLMQSGFKVTRKGWNGRRKNGEPMSVWLVADCLSVVDKPFFLMQHADDSIGVWAPVTNDVLAEDWEIVK
jgi:hypothetical protein